jgi:hypothetical protein
MLCACDVRPHQYKKKLFLLLIFHNVMITMRPSRSYFSFVYCHPTPCCVYSQMCIILSIKKTSNMNYEGKHATVTALQLYILT